MIIDGKVYDISQFALSHPGGSEIIFRIAGTDATQEFLDVHPPEYAWEYVGPAIGRVLQQTSPSSGIVSKAGLSVKLAEAESFAELREALQTRILTITGGFGAMVQRYMREQVAATSPRPTTEYPTRPDEIAAPAVPRRPAMTLPPAPRGCRRRR